jgi:hypothetical protein
MVVQASQSIKKDPIRKTANAKRTRSMIQVVERMPSKHKALSSTPSTTLPKKGILIFIY